MSQPFKANASRIAAQPFPDKGLQAQLSGGGVPGKEIKSISFLADSDAPTRRVNLPSHYLGKKTLIELVGFHRPRAHYPRGSFSYTTGRHQGEPMYR
jgi:hypothetical protein